MSQIQPVSVESGNVTIVPKLKRLILDNSGKESSIEIEWCKLLVETNEEIPQQNKVLSASVMHTALPEGFTRYNPLTGQAIPNAPNITQQEMMMLVYSVFKTMATTDLTVTSDPDVPEDELIVE